MPVNGIPSATQGVCMVTKYNCGVHCRIRMLFSMTETGSLKTIITYVFAHTCTCMCILHGELWQIFALLKGFVPLLHLLPIHLRNHCQSLMAWLLQAVLYDFWGKVSCTLTMLEEEAAGTTSSLNNHNNHFQQTDNIFLAGYSLAPQPM